MDILAADIGGTNSRFFLFSFEGGELCAREGVVLSSRAPTFPDLLEKLFEAWKGKKYTLDKVSRLAFAAAGPVEGGRIRMTNADFCVEACAARPFFPHADCLVMNDFEAQAWASLSPVARDLLLLHTGRMGLAPEEGGIAEGAALDIPEGPAGVFHALSGTVSDAPVAVLGAGTGLGAAWLLPPRGGAPSVLPSEAGHSPFPFDLSDADERGFAGFLASRLGTPVTAEHVLSGRGLSLLREHLSGEAADPQTFTREEGFGRSACCALFARFYGRFCRMAALSLLPQALVVTGGVAEKTPALVLHPAFHAEFLRARGAQRDFLRTVPVWLDRHPQSGLWGAACAGSMLPPSSL